MSKNSTKKNFIYYYIYQFTILLSTIVTIPYISNVLGSEMVGIYSFTFSIANFIYMFAELGTYTYGVREVALCRNNKSELSKTFTEIVLMKLISTIIWLSIYIIFINFQKNYNIYFNLWILFIVSAAFDITWFYAGIEHFEEIFIINIIIRIIGIVSTFTLIRSVNDLWIYITIHALLYLLPFSLMWLSLPKYISITKLSSINLFKHFSKSLLYFVPTISASLFLVIDKSMLGFLIEDKNESGYYEMASQIVIFSKTLSAIVISHVIQPKATHYYQLQDYKRIKKSIELSIEFSTFICIGMIFGILSVSHEFVPVFFGSKFRATENILRFMSPLILITAISYIYEYEYLVPAGKGKSINKYIVISATVNIILNFILITNYKSIGAVIASLSTELLLLCFFYKDSNSIVKFKGIFAISIKKIIAGILMSIIIYYLNANILCTIIVNKVLLLSVDVTIGIISYIFVLYILKDNIFSFINDLNQI